MLFVRCQHGRATRHGKGVRQLTVPLLLSTSLACGVLFDDEDSLEALLPRIDPLSPEQALESLK